MRTIICSLLIALLLLSASAQAEPAIINGGTAQPQPFMLRLQAGSVLCGAVLVAERWALTAAHCIDPTFDTATPDDATLAEIAAAAHVKAHEYDLSVEEGTEQRIGIAEITLFGYRFGRCCLADIALLRLVEPVRDAQPVSIGHAAPIVGQSIALYGWGYQNQTPRNPKLQEGTANVDYVFETTGRFCTRTGAWAGGGDSGGPGVTDAGELAGIISAASGTNEDGFTCFESVARHVEQITAAIDQHKDAANCPPDTVEIAGVCVVIVGTYPPLFLPIVRGNHE